VSDTMVWMLAALGGELVLLLLALLVFAWMRNRAARRRDAKAVRVLAERVRQGKSERQATLQAFLASHHGLQGEALTAATTALYRAELGVLQQFAGIYRARDAAAAAQFDIRLAGAVAPYHELTAEAGTVTGAADGEAPDAAEMDTLRRENKRLSDELKITMETMSRMLNEYSTMFSGAPPGESPPIAAAPVGDGAGRDIPQDTADVPPAEAAATDPPAGPSAEDDSEVEVTVDAAPSTDEEAAPFEDIEAGAADVAPETTMTGPDTIDKGTDLEAVSELLVAGSAERVTAEGGTVRADQTDAQLEEASALFDGMQDDGESEGHPADEPVGQDDIDDLFDVAEGLDARAAEEDDPESVESVVRNPSDGASDPEEDQSASLRR